MEQIFRKKSGKVEMSDTFKMLFNMKISELNRQKDCSASHLPALKYRNIINRLNEIKRGPHMKKESRDYRLLKQYEVVQMRTDNKSTVEMLQKPGTDLLYVPQEHLFDVISPIHVTSGHGGRDVMYGRTRKNYANVTKETLQLFTDLCEDCKMKKTGVRRVNLNGKSSIPSIVRRRCRVDVVDMITEVNEGDYRYVMMYEDLRTKYRFLKALKTQDAAEVANHLVDVFCAIGSPPILDSNNGRQFACDVITEVKKIWPQCIMVCGANPAGGEAASEDGWQDEVQFQVKKWMQENNSSKWWQGLRFVQWQMNNSKRGSARKSSYAALFHEDAKLGLQHANIPKHLTEDLHTESDLTSTLRSLTSTRKIKEEEPSKELEVDVKEEPATPSPCKFSTAADGINSRDISLPSPEEMSLPSPESPVVNYDKRPSNGHGFMSPNSSISSPSGPSSPESPMYRDKPNAGVVDCASSRNSSVSSPTGPYSPESPFSYQDMTPSSGYQFPMPPGMHYNDLNPHTDFTGPSKFPQRWGQGGPSASDSEAILDNFLKDENFSPLSCSQQAGGLREDGNLLCDFDFNIEEDICHILEDILRS